MHLDRQRLVAERAHLPRRNVEKLAAAGDRPRNLRGGRNAGARARPVAAGVRVRTQHPSMQGVLLDRGRALPLAVQLLSQLLARPDAGLDERDLPFVGPGAWDHADQSGQLVLADLTDEADDGPAGL